MLFNLLILIFFIVITLGAGWLTWRALRAEKLWIKIVGGLAAGLLTLSFASMTFLTIKGLAFMYVAPASAPNIKVEGTPEQIERGKYLVSVACVGCHTADGSREFPLIGGPDFASDVPIPIGTMVAANLTPGGVLAERTDGELFRAIRHGFGKGKRAGTMTFMPFRQLSDEDTEAIIAFLRSQEPVKTATNGGDATNILGAILLYGAGLQPLPETTAGAITAPPQAATPEYGRYVATFGECRACHGPDMTGTEATTFAPAFPNPRPFVGSITSKQFIEMMRTGVRPNGVPLGGIMPWKNAAAMSDEDLTALYAYLTTPPGE